jgi:RNA-directed DNA polymerase
MIKMFETKLDSVPITKQMVWDAYLCVKRNKGSGGVDDESLMQFEKNRASKLYNLWRRLCSGSYFPKPVREVLIPKSNGTMRPLGIPTVSDRIAQQVVKTYLEPRLEKVFHANSYGYRPNKSAHDALAQVEENTRNFAWVVDMDIKAFFDEVDHVLLQKAIDKHVPEKWAKLYINRWLESPVEKADGTQVGKDGKGTPQGGVISPLLANLFLHYVLDKWLEKYYPQLKFVRYADDVIVHCQSEEEAKLLLQAINHRLLDCKLRLSLEKTKIVYCRNYYRKKQDGYPKKFDFLGYTFKPQSLSSKKGGLFLGFGCSISQKSQSRIVEKWKQQKWHRQTHLELQDIANALNPQIRGIMNYYGKFKLTALRRTFRCLQFRLCKWVLNKYKSMRNYYKNGYKWLQEIKTSYSTMFYHWKIFASI